MKDMKTLIGDTLGEMVKQKSFDQITVTELVEACHISRQTFYYHFQDLLDVVDFVVKKTLDEILARSREADDLYTAIRTIVYHVQEIQPVLQKGLRSNRREQMESIISSTIRQALDVYFDDLPVPKDVPEGDISIVKDFYAYGIMGFLIDHRISTETEADILAGRIYRLISLALMNY